MVLIFVSSILCFAANEQPSGNNYYSIYSPRSYSTTWEKSNFWSAQNNLFQRLLFLIDGNGSSDTVSIRTRLLNIDNSVSDVPDLIDSFLDTTPGTHLGYYLKNSSDKATSSYTTLGSISSNLSTISSTWLDMYFSVLSLSDGLADIHSDTSAIRSAVDLSNTRFLSAMQTVFVPIRDNISALKDYFIDQHKVAAEERNESVQNKVLTDFITGSDSSVSLGTGKIGAFKLISSDFSSSLSSDASAGDTFSILTADSDDGFWAFFGSDVYSELNPSSDSDSLTLSSSDGFVINPLERYSSFFGGDD